MIKKKNTNIKIKFLKKIKTKIISAISKGGSESSKIIKW